MIEDGTLVRIAAMITNTPIRNTVHTAIFCLNGSLLAMSSGRGMNIIMISLLMLKTALTVA